MHNGNLSLTITSKNLKSYWSHCYQHQNRVTCSSSSTEPHSSLLSNDHEDWSVVKQISNISVNLLFEIRRGLDVPCMELLNKFCNHRLNAAKYRRQLRKIIKTLKEENKTLQKKYNQLESQSKLLQPYFLSTTICT